MNNLLVTTFLEARKKLMDREFLLYTIAYNTAPTLMRVKPATLMNISKDIKNSYEIWERNKEFICEELNIKSYELKKTNNNVFILFYNHDLLSTILNDTEVKKFLQNFSYDINGGIESVLNSLKKSFMIGCPHEIGILLGIPIDDVKGYINNLGRNYKFLSYWKVYNDIEGAKLLFNLYERSRETVIRDILNKINEG